MDITSDNHFMVTEDNGEPIRLEDGSVVIQNLEGQIFGIPPESAKEIFGYDCLNDSEIIEAEVQATPKENRPDRCSWKKEEILNLIHEYKAHEKLFLSTTVRNSSVWKKISDVVKTHTAIQCENKFKYLKANYLKKKESMGTTNSGGASFKCMFFDEMEDIFGEKPIVKPVAVASSLPVSNKRSTPSTSGEAEGSANGEPSISKKKTKLQTHLETLEIQNKNKERAKQKRHEEIIQRKDRALEIFNDFCSNMVQIMKKKTDGGQ